MQQLEMRYPNLGWTIRPGIQYKEADGRVKLYRFFKNAIEVIQIEPTPRAWRLINANNSGAGRRWVGCRPEFNVPAIEKRISRYENRIRRLTVEKNFRVSDRPPALARLHDDLYAEWCKTRQYSRFLDKIPNKVKEELHSFRFRHWDLLCFMLRSPEALKMARDERLHALAFFLALNHVYRRPKPKKPVRDIKRKLHGYRPRQGLAHWVGFNPNRGKSLIKFMRAFDVGTLSVQAGYIIRRFSFSALFPRVFGMPKLNLAVIKIITACGREKIVDSNFLNLIAYTNEYSVGTGEHILRLLSETRTLANYLGKQLGTYTSPEQLKKKHDTLVDETFKARYRRRPETFIQPPVDMPSKKSLKVVFVKDSKQLVDVAESMRLCLAQPAYLDRFRAGKLFGISIEHPEKGFCTIKRNYKNELVWDQCAGPNNRPLKEKTLKLLKQWLEPQLDRLYGLRDVGTRYWDDDVPF